MAKRREVYLVLDGLDRREIDVVFLNDTRVQRVKVHDKDVLVPQTTLWVEHETALVLVPLAFGGLDALPTFMLFLLRLDCRCRLLTVQFVRTDVLEAVELV